MHPVRVDRNMALRYLGSLGTKDEQLLAALEQAALLVEQTAQPRHSVFAAPITQSADGVQFSGTTLCLPGKDIASLLNESHLGLLFCATLGSEIERLINRWQLKDLSFAAMLDACASSAVEVYCDSIASELAAQYASEGLYLTDRFSPGYGDLPLGVQSSLCAVLDTPRRIGVQVSSSSLLSPRKSVTAVIGISTFPQPMRDRCSGCSQYHTCPFRKEGATCADP